MTFETKGLKALYCQEDETQALSARGVELIVNLQRHTADTAEVELCWGCRAAEEDITREPTRVAMRRRSDIVLDFFFTTTRGTTQHHQSNLTYNRCWRWSRVMRFCDRPQARLG